MEQTLGEPDRFHEGLGNQKPATASNQARPRSRARSAWKRTRNVPTFTVSSAQSTGGISLGASAIEGVVVQPSKIQPITLPRHVGQVSSSASPTTSERASE